MEFSIEKYVMLIEKSRKRQMIGTALPNQKRIRTLGKKETYKYLEILEDERKNKKVP